MPWPSRRRWRSSTSSFERWVQARLRICRWPLPPKRRHFSAAPTNQGLYALEMQNNFQTVLAALLSSLLAPTGALACQPIDYSDNKERMHAALEEVTRAYAAIDGDVVSGNDYPGSVAIIRPTRVWFGPKQAEYRVLMEDMCAAQFNQGDRVRIILNETIGSNSLSNRIRRKLLFWLGPTYQSAGFSNFSWAMKYRIMRRAVQRRAQATPRDEGI